MKKIGFLFSGQGAQFPGMMGDICRQYAEGREIFRTADTILGRSISNLTFQGTQEELNFTHNTQPCVLAADLAAYAVLSTYGILPDAIAGFSLGEYAALTAAKCISVATAFALIQKRADYMQEAVPVGKGAMAAINGQTLEEVRKLCDEVQGYVIPANLNCPGQIVVSGETEAVCEVVDIARKWKKKAMVLPVSAPFHCELLKPAAERLESVLREIRFRNPAVPIYMNVDGRPETNGERIVEKLVLQAKSPVYWEEILRNMYEDGVRIFIELGPGKTLSGFVKKTFINMNDIKSVRVSDMESLSETVKAIKEHR